MRMPERTWSYERETERFIMRQGRFCGMRCDLTEAVLESGLQLKCPMLGRVVRVCVVRDPNGINNSTASVVACSLAHLSRLVQGFFHLGTRLLFCLKDGTVITDEGQFQRLDPRLEVLVVERDCPVDCGCGSCNQENKLSSPPAKQFHYIDCMDTRQQHEKMRVVDAPPPPHPILLQQSSCCSRPYLPLPPPLYLPTPPPFYPPLPSPGRGQVLFHNTITSPIGPYQKCNTALLAAGQAVNRSPAIIQPCSSAYPPPELVPHQIHQPNSLPHQVQQLNSFPPYQTVPAPTQHLHPAPTQLLHSQFHPIPAPTQHNVVHYHPRQQAPVPRQQTHLVHPSALAEALRPPPVPPELLQSEPYLLSSSDEPTTLEKKLIVVSVNQQVPWPEQQQQQEEEEVKGRGEGSGSTHPGTSSGQEKEHPVCEQGCTAATVPCDGLDQLDVLNVNSPFSCLGASNASFDLCLQEEPGSGPSADGKGPLSAESPSEDTFTRCATWMADHNNTFSNRLPFEDFEERESRSPEKRESRSPPEQRGLSSSSSDLDSSGLTDDLVVRVPINFYTDLKEAETSGLVVRIPWKKFECV